MAIKKYSSGQWVDASYRKYETATDTITTLPKTIITDGQSASAIIKGNLSQSGTPTPTSPIYPSETGDKTANLWDEIYTNISQTIQYKPIYVGNGDFTLSTTTPYDSNVANVFLLSGNVSTGASTVGNGAWLSHNVTTNSENGYITIAYRHYSNTTNPADCQTMLNTGSTALPYQPHGYKIPILSGGVTTPVYLGEVQSTRNIKKLVLTGQETWYTKQSSDTSNYAYRFTLNTTNIAYGCLCTHLIVLSSGASDNVCIVQNATYNEVFYVNLGADIMNAQTSGNTVEGLKEYLAAQYANGTPVCVWYVLATPTTDILNEPIRKIGNYADSVSVTGIPTTGTAESFDVDTTLKPSEVDLTYHGWHEHTDTKYTI